MNREDQVMSSRAAAPTGWTGWVIFASVLMAISGIFQMIAGFTAVFKEDVYLVGANSLIVMDYSQWGWTHVVLGAILFLAAFALASGKMWARVLGIIIATLSAIANFMFIEAYPLWSILIIIIDVLVIYSIAVHGSELKEA